MQCIIFEKIIQPIHSVQHRSLNFHMGNRALQFFSPDKCFQHSTLLSIYWNLNIGIYYKYIIRFSIDKKSSIFLTMCVLYEISWWEGLWWVWSRLLVEIVEKSLHGQLYLQLVFLIARIRSWIIHQLLRFLHFLFWSAGSEQLAGQTGLLRWSWRFRCPLSNSPAPLKIWDFDNLIFQIYQVLSSRNR